MRTGEESIVQHFWRIVVACVASTKIGINHPLESQLIFGGGLKDEPQVEITHALRFFSLKWQPYAFPTTILSTISTTSSMDRSSPRIKLGSTFEIPIHYSSSCA
jgi:hypothetical protein